MMTHHKTGCLHCGNEIIYIRKPKRMKCFYCGEISTSGAQCISNHYICDRCHSLPAVDIIQKFCLKTKMREPLEMAQFLMSKKNFNMHGPEHHFLVPAVLISSFFNASGKPEKKMDALKLARSRATNVPGGSCGYLGNCGAAVGVGIFVSIVTNSTPLHIGEWRHANLATATSLRTIALHGGPRCCKRNTFLAIRSASRFSKVYLKTQLPIPRRWKCIFSKMNHECIENLCPFFRIKN